MNAIFAVGIGALNFHMRTEEQIFAALYQFPRIMRQQDGGYALIRVCEYGASMGFLFRKIRLHQQVPDVLQTKLINFVKGCLGARVVPSPQPDGQFDFCGQYSRLPLQRQAKQSPKPFRRSRNIAVEPFDQG